MKKSIIENQKAKVTPITKGKATELPEGFFYGESGLNYLDPNSDSSSPIWICSKLKITASTRDSQNKNWGRVLEFDDIEGHPKKWVMPMELLAGKGELLHSTLLNMGLSLSTSYKAKNLLSEFINKSKGQKIAVCVDRVGWFDGCYVLPDRTIGDTKGKEVLLQTAHPDSLGFSQNGTIEQWREGVARFAVNNSRLAFAISASFTALFISQLGIEGGGFHFRGESSQGKTIALYVAGSVWGDHGRKKMWRATTNGLEQTAFLHNDGLLLLDEMGEMNSREIGNAIYMLANGQAKQRMTESTPKQWRLLFLSTGEIDLKSAMLEAGNITKAGQEVRLIDLEAVAGDYGVFNVLIDGFGCSKDQAEHLESATENYYGSAGVKMLEAFIKDQGKAKDFIEKIKNDFIKTNTPPSANNQVKRVLNRFAIVAGGGELATHYGITGWQAGEAYKASEECFKSWLSNIGNVKHSQEHHQAIERIKGFIEQHGESRFSYLDAPDPMPTINRVGYRKREDTGTVYYFLPTMFKNEVCKGLNLKTVKSALKVTDLLITGSDGKDFLKRIPEHKNPVRLVAVKGEILG